MNNKKIIETLLDISKPEDREKLKRRVQTAARTRNLARQAAQKARNEGNIARSKQLDQQADMLDELIKKINTDELDPYDGPLQQDSISSSESQEDDKSANSEQDDQAEQQDDSDFNNDDFDDESDEEADGSDEDGEDDYHSDAESNIDHADELQEQIEDILDQHSDKLSDKQKEQLNNLHDKLDDLKEQAEQAGDDSAQQDKINSKLDNISNKLNNLQDKLDNSDGDDSDSDDDLDTDGQDGDSSEEDTDDQDGGSGNDSDEETDDDSEDGSNGSDDSDSKDEEDGTEGNGSDEDDSDESDEESDSKSKGNNGNSDDEDGDDEDDYDSDEDDDTDIVEDPFADEEDMVQNLGQGNGKQPREADLKDVIKRLNSLSGESKRGAIDGLKDLLSKTVSTAENDEEVEESLKLTEAIKGLRDQTDDEFWDLINGIMDNIEDLTPGPSLEDQKATMNQILNDPNNLRDINKEDRTNKTLEKRKGVDGGERTSEDEVKRYAGFPPISKFEIDFFHAVKDQVDRNKDIVKTYDEINNEYESENIIMKADTLKEIDAVSKPIVRFYFDMSGSWTGNTKAMDIGRQAVASMAQFHMNNEIELEVLYFSDADTDGFVTTAPAWDATRQRYIDSSGLLGGGTSSWAAIMTDVEKSGANNVVIMTDSDMEYESRYLGKTLAIDGFVWYIWHGNAAQELPKHLYGTEETNQYGFRT